MHSKGPDTFLSAQSLYYGLFYFSQMNYIDLLICFLSMQILKIRSQTEGIQIEEESLKKLGDLGVKTTLR